MIILETERLILSRFADVDAEFVLRLLNEPSFLQNIGDKGVRTLEDAQAYLIGGPLDSYERHGFGLYRVTQMDEEVPVGMCGLLKRDSLDDPDLGFAFLPEYWGRGYATEAASAAVDHARVTQGLERLLAIVTPTNGASIHVLEKIGMRYDGPIRLSEDSEEISLYELQLKE